MLLSFNSFCCFTCNSRFSLICLVIPSKLAESCPVKYEDVSSDPYFPAKQRTAEYREGLYVGYRYFETANIPVLFPFGFGLSYTDFSIRCAGVSAPDGRRVTVEAAVTNIGETYTGKEVAQLYVSAPNGSLDKEYQSLAAFAKTEPLAPGASQTLELTFDFAALASFREADAAYVLEPGTYILRLGNSSRNTVPAGILRLEREIVVSRHTHVCPLHLPLEELHTKPYDFGPLPDGLPRLTIRPETFAEKVYTYGNPPPVPDDPRVKQPCAKGHDSRA